MIDSNLISDFQIEHSKTADLICNTIISINKTAVRFSEHYDGNNIQLFAKNKFNSSLFLLTVYENDLVYL